jgi:hypothetical protein
MLHSHTCIGHHFMFPRVTEIKTPRADPVPIAHPPEPDPRLRPSERLVVLERLETR